MKFASHAPYKVKICKTKFVKPDMGVPELCPFLKFLYRHTYTPVFSNGRIMGTRAMEGRRRPEHLSAQ